MSSCLYIFIQCDFLLIFISIGKEKLKNLCDIKMLPSEEHIIRHKPSVCDFKIRKEKYFKRKLPDDSITKDAVKLMHQLEGYWKVLKEAFLGTKSKTCEWTKYPARHRNAC